MWYFTSPECAGSSGCSNLPSNSSNRVFGGLPRMLTSTLRRPRWAMPITSSLMPLSLQALGGGEAVQHALLAGLVQAALAGGLLEPAVDPVALLVVADVHELGADRAGVGLLQAAQQLAQFQALAAAGVVAGVEFGVQVGVGEAVEGEAEIRRRHLLGQAERVELGGEVAARTVGGEQAQHAGLLARVLVAHRHGGDAVVALLLCGLDTRNGRGMGDVSRLAALEGCKVIGPFGRYCRGIGQPGVVERFDVIGVAASELGGFEELADQVCSHVTTGREGMLAAIRVTFEVAVSGRFSSPTGRLYGWLGRIRTIIAFACCDAATRDPAGMPLWPVHPTMV